MFPMFRFSRGFLFPVSLYLFFIPLIFLLYLVVSLIFLAFLFFFFLPYDFRIFAFVSSWPRNLAHMAILFQNRYPDSCLGTRV